MSSSTAPTVNIASVIPARVWLRLDIKLAERNRALIQYKEVDGLMQERRNFSALTMELRLSCINPSICITGPKFAFNKWTYPVLSFNYIN